MSNGQIRNNLFLWTNFDANQLGLLPLDHPSRPQLGHASSYLVFRDGHLQRHVQIDGRPEEVFHTVRQQQPLGQQLQPARQEGVNGPLDRRR